MNTLKSAAVLTVAGSLLAAGCSSSEQATPTPLVTAKPNYNLEFEQKPDGQFSWQDCNKNPSGWVSMIDEDPMNAALYPEHSLVLGRHEADSSARYYTIGAKILELEDMKYVIATSNYNGGENTTINLATGPFSRLIESQD